jgi:hypothetical protein
MISRPLPAPFWAAFAAFGVYSAELNNFLRFEQYPLLRMEVFYAVAGGALVAVVFGLVYHGAGYVGKLPSRIIRAVLIAALVGYAVALLADGPYAKVAAGTALMLAWFARDKILRPLALMSYAALFVATLGIGQQTQSQFLVAGSQVNGPATSPPIVHIILDQHIGVEGLPERDPSAPEVKQLMTSFYTAHGFRLFGGAYSQYVKTWRSIPSILNFGGANESKASAYFKLLKAAGYRINVIQSGWIDYCSALVDRCTTYHQQSFAPIAAVPLSADQKALLIVTKMIPKSLSEAVFKAYVRLDVTTPVAARNLSPVALNGLAALRRLRQDLTNLKRGQVYFAHILLPHQPFELASDCSVTPIGQWLEAGPGYPIAARRNNYDRQVLCNLRAIREIVQTIDSSPAGRNAIIIVHGDHGSRIGDVEPMAENMGKTGDDALVAGFSTLFAVRAPGIPAGYDRHHYPVEDLMEELVRSDWKKTGSHPVARPYVNIIDQSFVESSRRNLPDWW